MKKKIGYTLVILVIIAVLMLMLNVFAKQKISTALEDNQIKHKEISLNIYSNNLEVLEPKHTSNAFKISAEKLEVKDFDYFVYLKNGKIEIEDIRIIDPVLNISETKQDSTNSSSKKFKENILINRLQVLNGEIRKDKKNSNQSAMQFSFSEFEIKEIAVDSASVKNQIPFKYKEYVLFGDSFYAEMNSEHDLSIEKIRMRDGRVLLEKLQIISKFEKEEFQKHVPHEKDRYSLSISEIRLDNLQFNEQNDSLKLSNPLMTINNADLEVYRDKTQPEDPRIKSLYNEKLRKLPFKVAFESVKVNNSRIVYLEKNNEPNPAGELSFENVSMTIDNLHNIPSNSRNVDVSANSLFQEAAQFTFNYSFHPNNINDEFTASGNLNTMKAAKANKFLNPAYNIKLSGEVDQLAFNLSGNNNRATGDLLFKFHNFKVQFQNKKDAGEKKILSGLANFFINNKALNKEAKQDDISIERVKNKSFWNFIWKFVFHGAKKSLL